MKKVESSSAPAKKPDRKTIERNRRLLMKGLCSRLVSLIPGSHFYPPKEFLSQHDQLEQAADYIRLLQERVEELRRRKTQVFTGPDMRIDPSTNGVVSPASELPILKIAELGLNLEVVLITSPWKNFKLHQVIAILEEEGASVVATNISNIGNKMVCTFHSEVKFSRVGVDTTRLCQRLQELIS